MIFWRDGEVLLHLSFFSAKLNRIKNQIGGVKKKCITVQHKYVDVMKKQEPITHTHPKIIIAQQGIVLIQK